ncbi:MAG: beta-galactosidase trimerization domain-containing protein [Planctomycetota bacterium]
MTLSQRHIHLDFHTSPLIDGIGRDFDPDAFGDTLQRARVTSINCFARCHHGHLYYQSKAFAERIHPRLERPNLLPEQIEACHKRGIRAPIYITVQWDKFTADAHPEWLLRDEHLKPQGSAPLLDKMHGFYDRLDISHPGFLDFLQQHVKEIFELMPVDGLWWDIVVPYFSYDPRWLAAMAKAGLDLHNHDHRTQYARKVIADFERTMSDYVRSLPQYNDDCTIFYNSGHVGFRHRDNTNAYSHLELESLPGGGWGYMHFPAAQRYARGLGLPTLGMTGKFHSSWGDFHGYKNEASLEFETFNMLALGATVCVGDQLPPRGVLDPATYELIGGVFEQLEAKEPWCTDAMAVTDIAVMNPEEFQRAEGMFHDQEDTQGRTDFGVVRILQELGHQFDFIDSSRDFSKYRLIILPDSTPVDTDLADKLKAFVEAGGSLILTHRAGLNPAGDAFADPTLFGVDYVGDAEFNPDFLHPEEALREGLKDTRYVMAQRAIEVTPTGDAELLARTERPFFNRTWKEFCSHQYAPTSGESVYPSAVRKGSVIYFAHPLFRMYDDEACRWVKRLIRNAINLLLPTTLVHHDGPSTLIATLNDQPAASRYALHLQHYIPERRGDRFDTVEDVIPLHALTLTVRPSQAVKSVTLVPAGETLAHQTDGDAVTFTIPKLEGHQIVELAYA